MWLFKNRKKKSFIKIGSELFDKGKFEESIDYFDKALEKDPNNINALKLKASALIFLKKREEAVKCMDMVLLLEPEFGIAWFSKGLLAQNLGKYEEAVEYFEKAIECNYITEDVYTRLSFVYGQLDKFEEHAKYAKKALGMSGLFGDPKILDNSNIF